MADAELNVQLRLLLDQVQGDAAKAAAIIKQQLGAALGGGLSGGKTSRDVSDMARSFAATGKVTAKMASDMDKISSISSDIAKANKKMGGNIFGKEGGAKDFWKMNQHLLSPQVEGGGSGRIRINLDEQRKKAQAKSDKDMVTFKKDMSFLAMPLFNPGSMWATLFSTRQTYSAMNTGHGASFRASKLGGMGAGAATGLLVSGATAAGLVLKALSKTVQETIAAYEHARQLYAKSLMSGLGLNFTVRRGMLASIIGVSETDVMKFGAAMAYLNPKIEWASQILAKTATPLTQVSWEFKILEADMSALFAKIANEAAPTILAFTDALTQMIQSFGDTGFLKEAVDILSKSAAVMMIAVGAVGTAIGSFVVGLQLIWDTFQMVIAGIYNLSLKLLEVVPKISAEMASLAAGGGIKGAIAGAVVGKDLQSAIPQDLYEKNKLDLVSFMKPGVESATALRKFMDGTSNMADALWSGGKEKQSETMPSPQAWMKQLPASHWEKMGLVIGGGASNHAAETSKNTKQTADILKKIYANMIPRGGGYEPNPAFNIP